MCNVTYLLSLLLLSHCAVSYEFICTGFVYVQPSAQSCLLAV